MNPNEPPESDASRATPVVDMSSMILLQRLQQGEEAAREELIRRYWPRLARWARGRLPASARDLYETTDLVQDTVMRALGHLDTFRPEHDGALLAYLRTAVLNRIRTVSVQAKRRGDRIDPEEDIIDRRPSPLEEVIGRDAVDRYERALLRLKPSERHAIQVRLELNLPYEEIARELEKPTIVAARMAVSRALYKLAMEMQRGTSM